MSESAPPVSRKVTIPVCYEKEFAIDMDDVAEYHNLSVQEIIGLHTEPLYYVYMMGFMPGFPYLGGLSEKLVTPRLENPRKRVNAVSRYRRSADRDLSVGFARRLENYRENTGTSL